MAALRNAAVLAAVAALASGAVTTASQQPESAQDVMAVDDLSPDAAQVEIQNAFAGHNLAARGYNNGGKNRYYYSYTYCNKWRGSCHYPYYYDQDYAYHRCSLYENTYYKPCYEVCCDYQPSHGGNSGYNGGQQGGY